MKHGAVPFETIASGDLFRERVRALREWSDHAFFLPVTAFAFAS